jgi:hypothetical protein
MFWLQSPAWGRRIAAAILVAIALWVELGPDQQVEHPFATETIEIGETLTSQNTETRRVPQGLLNHVDLDSVASRIIEEGQPITTTDLRAMDSAIPTGWWIVTTDLPGHARAGDRVIVILLDSGKVIKGVVASSRPDDPFAASSAGVAVAPGQASEVAIAAASSRIAVLISTG